MQLNSFDHIASGALEAIVNMPAWGWVSFAAVIVGFLVSCTPLDDWIQHHYNRWCDWWNTTFPDDPYLR